MIKTQNKQLISMGAWDSLVEKTYGKIYCFQQQDGCQERGTFHLTVPDTPEDYENDTLPEKTNGSQMGVSFKAWLARDPKEWNGNPADKPFMCLFWQRNFYPDIQMVANDLHEKGLLPAGEYVIEINW